MLQAKVIQPSVSEWAAVPVLIRKRDGQVRWCIEHRALNKVTSKDLFLLPLIEECLDTLAGNSWFSKIRCKLGLLANSRSEIRSKENCIYYKVWDVRVCKNEFWAM